jgi:hypothetical protein
MIKEDMIVHLLSLGRVICGHVHGPPATWPAGHSFALLKQLADVTCNSCINQAESMRPGTVKEQIKMLIRREAEKYAKETYVDPKESEILVIENSMLKGYNMALGNRFF